jgi:hypothetical protein
MRKITQVIVLVISAALVIYVALLTYKNAHEQTGDQLIKELIPIIEKAKRANGFYPPRIELVTQKVWGIFPGPKIAYRLEGAECFIYYYQWPLGPHRGFKFTTKEWYFEE